MSFDEAADALAAARQEGYLLVALEQDEKSIPLQKFTADVDTVAVVLGPEVTASRQISLIRAMYA